MKAQINIVKKVPSFTIIELMLTLVISTVIVSMVYFILLLFTKQMKRFIFISEATQTFYLFKRTFRQDLNDASAITDSSASILFMNSKSIGSRVIYNFCDSLVIRQKSKNCDTFRLSIRVDNRQVISDSVPLVHKIDLFINLSDERVVSTFYKSYTSVELIESESNSYEQ